MAIDSNDPFERIQAFEWDEDKRKNNIKKHGIDFEDAIGVFYGPILVNRFRSQE